VVAVAPVAMSQPTCDEVESSQLVRTQLRRRAVGCPSSAAKNSARSQAMIFSGDDVPTLPPSTALYEYLCYGFISAEFTREKCVSVGCYARYHEGQGYCSCAVTDSKACLAKLPGELSRTCVLFEVDGCMRASETGMAGR
jgi:hypothetical protein